MANIGYIRYSIWEENPAKQLENIKLDKFFEEKSTSSAVRRAKLSECLKFLKKGDMLHVQSIDRIARSMVDLKDLVVSLVDKGISIKFYEEKLIFTDKNSLLEQELFFHLNAFASFEKRLVKDRQKEGIYKAQLAGINFGRPRKISKKLKEHILAERKKGVPHAHLAKEHNVSVSSIYKLESNK